MELMIEDQTPIHGKSFKFLNIWAHHSLFQGIVEQNWCNDAQGCIMFHVV